MDPSTTLYVANNTARSITIIFVDAVAELSGNTLIQENIAMFIGVLIIYRSQVYFQGNFKCLRNRAESGIISSGSSDLYFSGDVLFFKNTAVNGGAVFLYTSAMHVSPDSTVNFTLNHAMEFGGAVYIINPRYNFVCGIEEFLVAFSCIIQVYIETDSTQCHILFNQNTAGIAGNAVYGDRISACIPANESDYCTNCPRVDFSTIMEYVGTENENDLSNFTSDATRVCFCKDGIPQCFSEQENVTVHPGELFCLSLATIGYGFGTVPGSVIAKIWRKDSEEQSFRDTVTSLGSVLQQSQEVEIKCKDVCYSILSNKVNYAKLVLAINEYSFSLTPNC